MIIDNKKKESQPDSFSENNLNRRSFSLLNHNTKTPKNKELINNSHSSARELNHISVSSMRVLTSSGTREAEFSALADKRARDPLSKLHNRPQVEYSEGASYLKVSRGGPKRKVYGGKRKKITSFSVASRRRLMYTIAKIVRTAKLPMFVTLTYPDKFPNPDRAKRDLKVFLQRLAREFPKSGLIWKMEPQKRGAPHFHILIWGITLAELRSWVDVNWYDIAGDEDINHLLWHMGKCGNKHCVQKVNSWRGVWSYASKYLGKTFDVAGWGEVHTGRFWGVVGRVNIPFGETVKMEIERYKAVQAMRYQRRFARLKTRNNQSLTIFCDASQWVTRLNLLN